jgi:hypothetical protein
MHQILDMRERERQSEPHSIFEDRTDCLPVDHERRKQTPQCPVIEQKALLESQELNVGSNKLGGISE